MILRIVPIGNLFRDLGLLVLWGLFTLLFHLLYEL
jgi:hypothetical protein